METVKATAAATAVASPWWLPFLHSVSDTAALVAPILGVMWLALQITHFIVKRVRQGHV
jgi:hypothetical protein